MEDSSRKRGTSSFPSASHSGSGDPGKNNDKDLERRRNLYYGYFHGFRDELMSHARDLFPKKVHEATWRAVLHSRFPKDGTNWEPLASLISEFKNDGKNHPFFKEMIQKRKEREKT